MIEPVHTVPKRLRHHCFSQEIFLEIERLIRHDSLELAILLSELLQALCIVDLQSIAFSLPQVNVLSVIP
jgi:hypothetical protein